jgi:hypothetical protein
MTNEATPVEKLIEKMSVYSKTSVEVYTLSAVYKTANIYSSLAVKLVLSIVVALFFLFLSIGLSLWIGSLLGKAYYGFFIVASVYLLVFLLIYIFRNSWIKRAASNFIISTLLN